MKKITFKEWLKIKEATNLKTDKKTRLKGRQIRPYDGMPPNTSFYHGLNEV